MRAAVLAICLLLQPGLQAEKPARVALDAKVDLKVPAGPLDVALSAIEKQAGLRFAVLPELLAPDLKVEAFTHSGPLAAGLDLLTKPLKLKWEIGEFGGIVLLPLELKIPAYDDWVARTFEASGVELLDVEEDGRNLGFRPGDVLLAINGERLNGYMSYRMAVLVDLKPDEKANFSVLRGKEQIQIQATPHRNAPMGSIGVTRYLDVPTEGTLYEKSGHKDPSWDDKFAKVVNEFRQKDDAAWKVETVLAGIKECIQAGCRDPQLARLLIDRVTEYSDERWKDVQASFDPAVLRSVYGGTRVLARAEVAARFLEHGSPWARDLALRVVECGWAATKDYRLGYGLALQHFLEGNYEACLKILALVRAPLRASHYMEDYPRNFLESQALQRLKRFDEALKYEEDYSDKVTLPHAGHAGRFHKSTLPLLKKAQGGFDADRLPGTVGLVTWKAHSALDAIHQSWTGGGSWRSVRDTGPSRYSPDLVATPMPDSVEAYFFPKFIKTYRASGYEGTLCLAFGAAPGQNPETPSGELAWTRSSVFRINSDLLLTRTHGSLGYGGELPLPGFANGYGDTLRFFKTPDFVSLRVNGAWANTDSTPCLSDEGWLAMAVTTAKAKVDVGVMVSTPRPYDNDRLRELMESISKPGALKEDQVKAWYEAASLSPPTSVMRKILKLLPDKAKEKFPLPVLAEDAPELGEMTVAQALERLKQRGPVRWALPDALDADRVWCARPNGTIESISRVRYFSSFYPRLRGADGDELGMGEPVFQKDAVWFPTRKGLFRYDRVGDVFRNVPLGGVLIDAPITSLSLKDGELIVAAQSTWVLDLGKGTWTCR